MPPPADGAPGQQGLEGRSSLGGLHSSCTPAPSNYLNMLMGHGPLKAETRVRIPLGPPFRLR